MTKISRLVKGVRDLEVGDRLLFNDVLATLLEDLSINHPFNLGDELEVVQIDTTRKLPILVGAVDPACDWAAWLYRAHVETARTVWKELHGVVDFLTEDEVLTAFAHFFDGLSPEEAATFRAKLRLDVKDAVSYHFEVFTRKQKP